MRSILPLLLAALAAPVAALQDDTTEQVTAPAPVEERFARPPIGLLVDADTGQVLFAREEHRRFIPASITKVMSAYVAFGLMGQGTLDADDVFTVSDETGAEWERKGSTMFLRAGDEVLVGDLLKGITSVSANDASIVLAEGAAGTVPAWLEAMNVQARKLGLRNTRFGTPNGWPDDGRTFTSAADLAILGRALVRDHPEAFATYFGRDGFAYNGFAQANRDPITGWIDGADGIKTGFTREAGHGFLGTAERDGQRLMMVVAALETEEDRAAISRELISWGFDQFEPHQLFEAGALVAAAQVQDGERSTVPLSASQNIKALVPRETDAEVSLALEYDGPLRAPIAQGEEVARLTITVEGMRPFSVPLSAMEPVERASAWQRLLNGLQGLFA